MRDLTNLNLIKHITSRGPYRYKVGIAGSEATASRRAKNPASPPKTV